MITVIPNSEDETQRAWLQLMSQEVPDEIQGNNDKRRNSKNKSGNVKMGKKKM